MPHVARPFSIFALLRPPVSFIIFGRWMIVVFLIYDSWLNSIRDAISFVASKKRDLCVHHLCPMGGNVHLQRPPHGRNVLLRENIYHIALEFPRLNRVTNDRNVTAENYIRVYVHEKIYAKKWHCVELVRARAYKGNKVSSHQENRAGNREQFIAFTARIPPRNSNITPRRGALSALLTVLKYSFDFTSATL